MRCMKSLHPSAGRSKRSPVGDHGRSADASFSTSRFRAAAATDKWKPATECPTPMSAETFLPAKLELPVLRAAAAKCRGCNLYCNATQTVFGEGPANAIAVFVGEQPGDQEDLAGKPFVGPAGRLL